MLLQLEPTGLCDTRALDDLDPGMHRGERKGARMTGRDILRGVRMACYAAFNHKDTKVTKDRHEGADADLCSTS